MIKFKGRLWLGLTAACAACGGDESQTRPPSVVTSPSPSPTPTGGSATGQLRFTNVTGQMPVSVPYGYLARNGTMPEMFSGGAAVGDYDGDGDDDIFIVRGDIGPNLLFQNNGGSFAEVAQSVGLAFTKATGQNYRHSGPTFGDIDGDGDPDLFVGGIEGDPSLLFRNDNGRFVNITASAGLDRVSSPYTISAAFGDYDRDGDLDIALAHWGTPRDESAPGDTETLWRNDSNANGIKFTSVSEASGIAATIPHRNNNDNTALGPDHDYTFTPRFADVNNDGWPDLLIAADFSSSKVYINDRDGTFSDRTLSNQILDQNGMGAAVGDYDNDGDLDWFVTSIRFTDQSIANDGNRFYLNDGGGFRDITDSAGIRDGGWGWGACFADFNQDGYLDLYHTNGWDAQQTSKFFSDTSRLFINDRRGGFGDASMDAGVIDTEQGRGVLCNDFDGDGDIDILLLHRNSQNSVTLWRNDLNTNNYLQVELRGKAPNTAASGARIFASAGGTTQMREISIGSNFISQNGLLQHFGLGTQTEVETLRIVWPDGSETLQQNVAAGQRLQVRQPSG